MMSKITSKIMKGVAFLAIPFAVFAPKSLVIWFVLFALASFFPVALQFSFIKFQKSFQPIRQNSFILWVLLGSWALLSALWSIHPAASFSKATILSVFIFLGLGSFSALSFYEENTKRKIFRALGYGYGLALFFLLVEFLTKGALTRYIRHWPENLDFYWPLFNRMAGILVLMIWIVGAMAARKILPRSPSLVMIFISSFLIMQFESLAAQLALFLSAFVFILLRFAPKITRGFFIIIIPLLIVTAPLLPHSVLTPANVEAHIALPPSAMHRVHIWHFVSQKIAEKPFLGHGLFTSRDLPGGKDPIPMANPLSDEAFTYLPLHPHNAILELWVELGFIGALILAGLWAQGSQKLLSPTTNNIAISQFSSSQFSGAFMISALTLFSVSFGMSQGWWQACLWLLGLWFLTINKE